jgi:hypothetical protein
MTVTTMADPQTQFAFLDTNLFLQFRLFDEIDWPTLLKAERVTLLIAPVVLRELDAQKAVGRTKRVRQRASLALSKLAALADVGLCAPVRSGVEVEFLASDPVIDLRAHGLRPDLPDDFFIASALEFPAELERRVVVTADLGLKMKARARNLRVATPPDSLRLPEEVDEEQKVVRELQARILRLESRAPRLAVRFADAGDRFAWCALADSWMSHDEIQAAVNEARNRFMPISSEPLVGTPAADLIVGVINERGQVVPTQPPRQKTAREAKVDLVMQYAKDLEAHLSKVAELNRRRTQTAELSLEVVNDGTLVATDIDLELSFPNCVEVFGEDPIGSDPAPPREPPSGVLGMFDVWNQKILGAGFVLPSARPYLGAAAALPRNCTTRISEDREQLHVHGGRLKHGSIMTVPPHWVRFRDGESVRSFHIPYRISAAELPDEVEGALHVVVSSG